MKDGSLPIRFIDDVEDAERFLEALAEQSRKPCIIFIFFSMRTANAGRISIQETKAISYLFCMNIRTIAEKRQECTVLTVAEFPGTYFE
jgi:hypothetical protein